MATEQASSVTADTASLAKWSSWLAALVGLWVLVSPFALSETIASGPAMWSNIIAGVLVLALAGFGAYEHRTTTVENTGSRWSGWLAALAGLWILASPFLLTGPVTSGTAMWSNVVAGVVAAILAAYAGYGAE